MHIHPKLYAIIKRCTSTATKEDMRFWDWAILSALLLAFNALMVGLICGAYFCITGKSLPEQIINWI